MVSSISMDKVNILSENIPAITTSDFSVGIGEPRLNYEKYGIGSFGYMMITFGNFKPRFDTGVRVIRNEAKKNFTVIFKDKIIHGVCSDKIGFIGDEKGLSCILVEVKHDKKYSLCVVHKQDGLIAERKIKAPYMRKLSDYSDGKAIMEQLVFEELSNPDKIKYSDIEFSNTVETEHLVGKFEMLDEHYIHVKFYMYKNKVNTKVSKENSLLGNCQYSVIIDKRSGKVLNNKVYTNIHKITGTLFGLFDDCVVAFEFKSIKDDAKSHSLINLKTGNTLISDALINFFGGIYIEKIDFVNDTLSSVGIYTRRGLSDELETVIEPIRLDDTNLVDKPKILTTEYLIKYKDHRVVLYGKESETKYLKKGKTINDVLAEPHKIETYEE